MNMQNTEKTIRLFTITLIGAHFFIPVAAGHGIGFLGFVELFWFEGITRGELPIDITGSYEERLTTAAMVGLPAYVLLAWSLIRNRQKTIMLCAGIVLLLVSFVLITYRYPDSSADRFSFWGGFLFLLAAILLIFSIVTHQKNLKKAISKNR